MRGMPHVPRVLLSLSFVALRIRPEILDFDTDFGLRLGQTKPKIPGTVPTDRNTTIPNDSGPISGCLDDDPKLLIKLRDISAEPYARDPARRMLGAGSRSLQGPEITRVLHRFGKSGGGARMGRLCAAQGPQSGYKGPKSGYKEDIGWALRAQLLARLGPLCPD